MGIFNYHSICAKAYYSMFRNRESLNHVEKAVNIIDGFAFDDTYLIKEKAYLLEQASQIYLSLGDIKSVNDICENLISQNLKDNNILGKVSFTLATTLQSQMAKTEALNYYLSAYQYFLKEGNKHGMADTLFYHGYFLKLCGDREADFLLDKAVAIYKELIESDTTPLLIKAKNHLDLSVYYQQILKNSNLSERSLLQALRIFESEQEWRHVVSCLLNLGTITMSCSLFTNAENYYLRALNLAEKIEDDDAMAMLNRNLGACYENRFRVQNDSGARFHATHYYWKAYEQYKKGGNNFGTDRCMDDLQRLWNDSPIPIEESTINNLLKIPYLLNPSKELSPSALAIWHHWRGRELEKEKKFEEANKHFEACLRIRGQIADESASATVLHNIAVNYARNKDWKNAERYMLKSLEIDAKDGYVQGVVLSLHDMSVMFSNKGEIEASQNLQALKKSLDNYKTYRTEENISYVLKMGETINGEIGEKIRYSLKLLMEREKNRSSV